MAVTTSTPARLSAHERREHLLALAMEEFARRGFEGGSTERIASAAGISQPYVFRLFGSKLQLFIAMLDRCFADTYDMFREYGNGLSGEPFMDAITEGYTELVLKNPARLQAQFAGYAACDREEVRASVRAGVGRLVLYVEEQSGLGTERVASLFAKGMLLNVLTAMQMDTDPAEWGDRLILGCNQSRPDA